MIVWFLVLAALAAGVAWLADRPGEIVIDWLGYRIETSLALALLALFAVLAVLWLALALLSRIVHIPAAVTGSSRSTCATSCSCA